MAKKINPNLKYLCQAYKDPNLNGAVLEGSSRSGKTWSGLDFLIWLASKKIEGKTINIIRETYNSFKTTLYLDFNKRLPMFGLASPFQDVQERSTFKLFGNQVNLIGADKPSKFMGAGCDILWLNEAIHIDQKIFDQAEMRCSDFWFMDYNPEMTEHWIYDNVLKRDNVGFLRTTFLDNPFVPKSQKDKILSYDPNNPRNVEQGTADQYLHDVFALGKRAKRQGAILTRWERGKFDDSLQYGFGTDWGHTHYFTLIKVAVDHPKRKIYVKQIAYDSGQTPSQWIKTIVNNVRPDEVNVCDSAYPFMIKELRDKDHNAISAYKPPGSVYQGLLWMLDYLIVVDDSPNIEHELNNYVWADKKSNTPVKENDDAIDSIRYFFTWYRMNVLGI